MKPEKFNYTARSVTLYQCPCCAAEWRTNQLDYCPNCEVKLKYVSLQSSEGEIDWKRLREEFFEECIDIHDRPWVGLKTLRVNMTPHNLFEWFRIKLSTPTEQPKQEPSDAQERYDKAFKYYTERLFVGNTGIFQETLKIAAGLTNN